MPTIAASSIIPPRRAVQVDCARCGVGVERVEYLGIERETNSHFQIRVECHGAFQELLVPIVQMERSPMVLLIAFEDAPERDCIPANTPTLSGEIGDLQHDGVGGASTSGVCSCGTAGCHIDARSPGCPRYHEGKT